MVKELGTLRRAFEEKEHFANVMNKVKSDGSVLTDQDRVWSGTGFKQMVKLMNLIHHH